MAGGLSAMQHVKNIDETSDLKKNSSYSKKNFLVKKEFNILIIYLYILGAVGFYYLLPNEHASTNLYYIGSILFAVGFAALAQNSKSAFFLNIFLSMSFFVLFFNIGYRNNSGIDDYNYALIFSQIAQYGWFSVFLNTTMEPGYLMLNKLVYLFTDNYLYMQLISSFIPLALFYRGFKQYRNVISIPMAVFLLITMFYFIMISVSLVRMFIALSIVFNAFYYIPKRNISKYVLLIILASLFHYSALFMLVLVYFGINKENLYRKSKRFIVIGFIITPIVFVAVGKIMVPFLGVRYAGYGTVNNLSLSFSSFDTVPLLILLLLFYRKIDIEYKLYYKLFLSIFALSFILSFYDSLISLGRLTFYANSAFFLAAPMVSRALNSDSRKVFFTGIIVLYGFIYLYRTQFLVESFIPHLYPYKNLFFII